MKKIDKLKRQRYDITMRIIELESRPGSRKMPANVEKELHILKEKEAALTQRINEIMNP